jgi:hypothetical protein
MGVTRAKRATAPNNFYRAATVDERLIDMRWDRLINRMEFSMTNMKRIATRTLLLGLVGFGLGCVAVPREGYYDGDHHRYYHENNWHECGNRDEHCH